MPDGPRPVMPSTVLAAYAAMSGWISRATAPGGATYGRGRAGTPAADRFFWPQEGTGGIEWAQDTALPSSAFLDCLMPQATYNLLHSGSLTSGGVTYEIELKNEPGVGTVAVAVVA